MSDARRALSWALAVALFTIVALMVSGEPGKSADTTPPITTPSTSTPVIYQEQP